MEDRKFTRYEQMMLRHAILDVLNAGQQVNLYLPPAAQARVKAAWDLVKDKQEPSLRFYEKKRSSIIMPSSASYVPKVKAPGKPGITGV